MESDSPPETSGREIWAKRIVGAVFWNVILQLFMLNLFLCAATLDLAHPVGWFSSWALSIFTVRVWTFLVPMSSVVIAQGVICSRHYIYPQPFHGTRFSLVTQVFSPRNLSLALLHVFIGFSIPWIYTSLSSDKYNTFVYPCTHGNELVSCFSEDRLFLVLGGIWVSVFYHLCTHFKGPKHIKFPVIQQRKFAQVKGTLAYTLRSNMHKSITPSFIFVILYYLRGGQVRDYICKSFDLNLSSYPLDSIRGLFSLNLLFYLWLFSTFVMTSIKLTKLWLKVYLTERHIFPMPCGPVNISHPSLKLNQGLQMSTFPIVQHLAFLDLYLLSEKSASRRQKIFSLSQPGGHPHTWNALKKECFACLDKFNDDINFVLKGPLPDLPEPPTFVSPRRPPPPIRSPNEYFVFNSADSVQSHGVSTYLSDLFYKIADRFVLRLNERLKTLYKLPIVVYLFGDLNDMRMRYILMNSLPAVWSAQTISLLACHSLNEDPYGIIQNDLPQILSSLVKTKQTLDTLSKHSANKKALGKPDQVITNLNHILKQSLKRSIYRVAVAFKPYISDIQMPKETEAQLLPFLSFRE